MSRTRKAVVNAGFGYAQFAIGTVGGLVSFPLVIHYIGAYRNGLWLATGEVVGYFVLADLGVFAVLPWLIAAKDGRQDRDTIRRYLSAGVAVGGALAAVTAVFTVILMAIPAGAIGLSSTAWREVQGPLVILAGATAASFPFKVFSALLIGIQEATAAGALGLLQTALTVTLTLILIPAGTGLVGLALAVAVPPLVSAIATTGVAYLRAPDLFRDWHRPAWKDIRHLVTEGAPGWLSNLGFRLWSSSTGIIFAWLGHPVWSTSFAGTAKASQIVQNLGWLIPDSGLIGLSHLYGEGGKERSRDIVRCILSMHLIISCGSAFWLLLFNPLFVRLWVGGDLYAGHDTNILLVLNLVLNAVAHGAITVVAVVSHRKHVGMLGLANGAAFVALAIPLCYIDGIRGIVEASLLATGCISLPCSFYLLRVVYGISFGTFVADCFWPWLWRSAPFLIAAGWLGVVLGERPALQPLASGVLLGVVYLWTVRPLVAAVPWPVRARPWLIRMRLIPVTPCES